MSNIMWCLRITGFCSQGHQETEQVKKSAIKRQEINVRGALNKLLSVQFSFQQLNFSGFYLTRIIYSILDINFKSKQCIWHVSQEFQLNALLEPNLMTKLMPKKPIIHIMLQGDLINKIKTLGVFWCVESFYDFERCELECKQ